MKVTHYENDYISLSKGLKPPFINHKKAKPKCPTFLFNKYSNIAFLLERTK